MGSSLAHRQQDHYPIAAYLTGTIYSHFLALVSFVPNWRESLTTQRDRERKKQEKKKKNMHPWLIPHLCEKTQRKKQLTRPRPQHIPPARSAQATSFVSSA